MMGDVTYQNYFLKYILDEEGNPKIEHDIMKWAEWFETSNDRIVGRTDVGNLTVSTVFLGVNHGFETPLPVLWETLVFGGETYDFEARYTSLEDAKEGHAQMVDELTQKEKNNGQATEC